METIQTLAASQNRRPSSSARALRHLRGLLDSRLLKALTYPHTIDEYLQLSSPIGSVAAILAEVVDVVRETRDVVTLVLRPNENFGGHQAGQYLAVTVEIDGARHTRCFSISSAPERADGLLTLTVKARAHGGLVSPFLVQHARPGMRVELSEALGDFVLPAVLPERVLFISGGSGITPCMSMLRSLAARSYRGELVFVHYARSPEDVIFRAELERVAARLPGLRLVIETEAELGRMPSADAESLARILPDFHAFDCWVCGPAPLMDAVEGAYDELGLAHKVRHERFVNPGSAAPQEGEAGALTFSLSKKLVEGDTRTLLEQAEAAGLQPKSGCRMGICQTCRCKKRAGVTKDTRTGALSTEDGDEIRLCVSVPVGDVTLEL